MKTAEEILIANVAKTLNIPVEESKRQFDEGMKEEPELISLINAMKEYATEAIKADRERVAEGARVKHCRDKNMNLCFKVDKESIINLPINLL